MTNEEIVKQIHNGFSVTDNMLLLYNQNLSMIKQFIKIYSHYDCMEDLLQQSYFGLVKAVNGYDEQIGTKFITYARFWIVAEVRNYVFNKSSAVRLPSYLRERIKSYNKFIREYTMKNERYPDGQEIQKALHYSQKQIEEIKIYSTMVISLEAEIKENMKNDSYCLLDCIQDVTQNVEDDVLERAYKEKMAADVRKALECLTEREKAVIREMYYNKCTKKEAAGKIGISESRVGQLQSSALERLKKTKRNILNQYAEQDSKFYCGTKSNFKQHGGSMVEHIAIKRYQLGKEYDRIAKNALGNLVH